MTVIVRYKKKKQAQTQFRMLKKKNTWVNKAVQRILLKNPNFVRKLPTKRQQF